MTNLVRTPSAIAATLMLVLACGGEQGVDVTVPVNDTEAGAPGPVGVTPPGSVDGGATGQDGAAPGSACASVTCSGHGQCAVTAAGSALCVCAPGYEVAGPASTDCVKTLKTQFGCQGVTCGAGTCKLTTTNVAYCECNAGFHADGLTCVAGPACQPTIQYQGFAADPLPSGSTNTSNPWGGNVLARGSLVYRSVDARSISIFDVSTPAAPIRVSRIDTACKRAPADTTVQLGPFGIAEKGGFLYVGCQPADFNTKSYVQVWDVRTPSTPALVKEVSAMGNRGLTVRGNKLFGFGGAQGGSAGGSAFVADVTDPANPTVGASLKNTPVWDTGTSLFAFNPGQYCTGLAIEGTRAALACGRGVGGGYEGFKGLFFIDISDTDNPTIVSRLYDGASVYPKLVSVRGSRVLTYSAAAPLFNNGELSPTVSAIDITNLQFPLVIDKLQKEWSAGASDSPGFVSGTCIGLTDIGGAGMLSCYGGGNKAIDFAAPPIADTQFEPGCQANQTFVGVAATGTKVYASGDFRGKAGCAGGASGPGLAVYGLTTCP